jgi:hypothetical protein
VLDRAEFKLFMQRLFGRRVTAQEARRPDQPRAGTAMRAPTRLARGRWR